MKIMVCIPQLIKGGAERVACNVSNYLSKESSVTLVSTRKIKPEYFLEKNINICFLDEKKDVTGKINKLFKRLIKLKKIINDNNPDVILCFLPDSSFYTLFLNFFNRKKIIVSVRNDPKVEYKNVLNKIIMKILYPRADAFIFQTEEAKSFFSKKIQSKSKIIMNSVSDEFIDSKVTVQGNRKKEIVSVGRLNQQKNQLLLIKAFERIYTDYKDYKLIIYGEGKERKNLENYIKINNLSDYVFLPGSVDNIKEKIISAKIFVLSSKYEGMPNALLEAMCLGIPCISTNCPCGGPSEIITNNYSGLLIDVNDVEGMSIAMRKIIDDDKFSEQLSTNAICLRHKVNPQNVNKEWKNYIKEIYEK